MLTPSDWSVVVLGGWNRAVLTPSGIAQKIFSLEKGTPVQVQIPLDGLSPCRVSGPEGEVVVMADDERLQLLLTEFSHVALSRARNLAIKALEALPETPLVAAGFNLGFTETEPSPEMLVSLDASVDKLLASQELRVHTKTLIRSMAWKGGSITLSLKYTEPRYDLALNFEKRSGDAEALIAWLKMDEGDIANEVRSLASALKLELGEEEDGSGTDNTENGN